jgi:hypothetical protein
MSAAWGWVWAAAIAVPAHADERGSGTDGRFALEIKACPAVSTEDLRRILGIEVGDLLIGEAEGVPAGADRLTIRCAGNFAWIEAVGPGDQNPLEQILRLDGFPGDAAPRALALAGLELLAARSSVVRERMDAKRSPPPVSPSEPRRPPTAASSKLAAPHVRPRPAASARETRVGVAVSWRKFLLEHGASAWGGQLQASTTLGRMWQVAGDADVARAHDQAGSLGETTGTLLSSGATFGVRSRGRYYGTSCGLGGRVGGVRLSGTSAHPATVSAASVWRPWGGPMAAASFWGGLARLALTLRAEAGYSLLAPEGQAGGVTVVSLRGPWAAIAVGASIRP